LILLQVQSDLGTATERRAFGIASDREGATGRGAPDVLLIIIVLGDDLDALGNKIGTVETNTKLTYVGY
jgi:hypothetical protein